MMIIGGVYHALFVYTGLIACCLQRIKHDVPRFASSCGHPVALLRQHQRYLAYTYRWSAASGLVGTCAFIWTCLTRPTRCPPWLVCLAPAFSAPLKLLLKRRLTGGLVLCGGLTNLWNLLFFLALTFTVAR